MPWHTGIPVKDVRAAVSLPIVPGEVVVFSGIQVVKMPERT
jgi:hypothetical protein